MSDDTDSGTNADCLESTPSGVGNDGSKDGDDVGEEGEHGGDGRSLDRSETESTGRLVGTGSTGSDSTGTVSSFGELSSDEILEDVLTSVVRCSFTEFDETHGNTDPTDWGRNPACQRKLPSTDQKYSLPQSFVLLLGRF